mmetsp:Transcript_25517/g.46707  ORF Transcript_25517/g.46707 Transcript_25517/m.46707 type:complete len:297 (-) Transcript_25517:45-935(-)
MAAKPEDDVFLGELAKVLGAKRSRMSLSRLVDQVAESDDSEELNNQEVLGALLAMGFKPTREELKSVVKLLEDEKEKQREKVDTLPFPRPGTEFSTRDSFARINQADREELRQIFCLFKQLCRSRAAADEGAEVSLVDWDQSGSISVDELQELLETVGLRIDQSELEAKMQELDIDGNGEVDIQEFVDTLSSNITVNYSREEIAESFKVFAKKAPDGYIKVADLRTALQTFMHKDLIDSEIDSLLIHFKDSMGTFPGGDEEYFNYQDYIELMTPLVDMDLDTPSRRFRKPRSSRLI